ncbi:cytochrome c biogenesis protein CcsA [Pelagibius litoralis]|nr:cytochrome c biogenesis protein CcsA [Pelagibius litoralis]
MNTMVLSLSALISLLPATVLPFARSAVKADLVFWLLLGAAIAGPTGYSLAVLAGHWESNLPAALWLAVAVSLALYALVVLLAREAFRLAPLLLPYALVLGALGTALAPLNVDLGPATDVDAWLAVHIAVSVATYGLCTLAAVAAAAAFIQETALKRRSPSGFTRMLPSVSDAEWLVLRLLIAAEVVLGLGIVTGISKLYVSSGAILNLDHKTLLSLLAFLFIALLLFLHHRSGLRGRRAARLVLIAYLLLSLAYPGVKFVTDYLLA